MPFAPLLLTLALHAPTGLDVRRNALDSLLKEHWEYSLKEQPELGTIVGDGRYNDRWTDGSLTHRAQRVRDEKSFLRRFEAIDPRGFPEQETLSRTIMIRELRELGESRSLGVDLMPVDQLVGYHLFPPQIADLVPTAAQNDADDYLARLRDLPRVLDDLREVLLEGKRRRLMPPAFLLDKVVVQCREIAAAEGEKSPFASPLRRMSAALADANRAALVTTIDRQVRPAYERLAGFLEREYAPFGRTEPGLWALPRGEKIYRYTVRRSTTTNRTPEEIHRTGLREVARIQTEMDSIARAQGYADRKAFDAFLKTDPAMIPKSSEVLLERYRSYIEGIRPMLPKLFERLPKAGVEVQALPDYAAANAPGAAYVIGAADGSRPGYVQVNTSDLARRSLLGVEAIAYHEGIPGHHMQLSLAQELTGLPEFRRFGGNTAYVEGWALYTESLGKELGFYKDPVSDYGRLSGELWRACRLVLDTGVHAKRWTRREMVDYFHRNTNLAEPEVEAETDRYIAMPGQALGYKIGQMEILALRKRAERELERGFDLRAFHNQVLDAGALPLDVLRARIETWIRRTKG